MIYLSAGTDAVDAAAITKDRAMLGRIAELGLAPNNVAAIGDGTNDLPFLSVPGLALVGAPQNAQHSVKQAVRAMPTGRVSPFDQIDGFIDLYDESRRLGCRCVFTDRDGVLLWQGSQAEFERLRGVFLSSGLDDNPAIFVLTGSSYEQNVAFLNDSDLAKSLDSNEAAKRFPYLILAENGAIQINVFDQTARFSGLVDNSIVQRLTTVYRSFFLDRLATVLRSFEIPVSDSDDEAHSRLFLPPKRTMVTVNLPRTHREQKDFQRSRESQPLRAAVLQAMVDSAQSLGMDYTLL